jgi:hypothetical protein
MDIDSEHTMSPPANTTSTPPAALLKFVHQLQNAKEVNQYGYPLKKWLYKTFPDDFYGRGVVLKNDHPVRNYTAEQLGISRGLLDWICNKVDARMGAIRPARAAVSTRSAIREATPLDIGKAAMEEAGPSIRLDHAVPIHHEGTVDEATRQYLDERIEAWAAQREQRPLGTGCDQACVTPPGHWGIPKPCQNTVAHPDPEKPSTVCRGCRHIQKELAAEFGYKYCFEHG